MIDSSRETRSCHVADLAHVEQRIIRGQKAASASWFSLEDGVWKRRRFVRAVRPRRKQRTSEARHQDDERGPPDRPRSPPARAAFRGSGKASCVLVCERQDEAACAWTAAFFHPRCATRKDSGWGCRAQRAKSINSPSIGMDGDAPLLCTPEHPTPQASRLGARSLVVDLLHVGFQRTVKVGAKERDAGQVDRRFPRNANLGLSPVWRRAQRGRHRVRLSSPSRSCRHLDPSTAIPSLTPSFRQHSPAEISTHGRPLFADGGVR